MTARIMIRRLLLFAAAIYLSWLAMQAVHELGHVLAATFTGGTVARVVIHPLAISRTDLASNPAPTTVAWGGPLVGVALPLLLTGTIRLLRLRRGRAESEITADRRWTAAQFLGDYFAGFCLIANGVYIGVGSFDGVGDAGDLLRHGTPRWMLLAFGLASSIGGLLVWHLALNRGRNAAI